MNGPYSLTEKKFDELVAANKIGNYALGRTDEEGTFLVSYIGRSDSDLNSRLKDYVGNYRKFKYSIASSIKEAFEKECNNYHDFGGSEKLKNDKHPNRPVGKDWECPGCDVFD